MSDEFAVSFPIPFVGQGSVGGIPAVLNNPSRAGYNRPWRFTQAQKSGISRIMEYSKKSKGIKINLEIRQFPPDGVKCFVEGKTIVVMGQHSMKKDKIGKLSREFKRTYTVPEDIDLNTLTSKVSRAGTLKIVAMKKSKEDTKKQRQPKTKQKEDDKKKEIETEKPKEQHDNEKEKGKEGAKPEHGGSGEKK